MLVCNRGWKFTSKIVYLWVVGLWNFRAWTFSLGNRAYNSRTPTLDFCNPRRVLPAVRVHWRWGTSTSWEGFCLELVKIDFTISLMLTKEAKPSLCPSHFHLLNSLVSDCSISGPGSFQSYHFSFFLVSPLLSRFPYLCCSLCPNLVKQN